MEEDYSIIGGEEDDGKEKGVSEEMQVDGLPLNTRGGSHEERRGRRIFRQYLDCSMCCRLLYFVRPSLRLLQVVFSGFNSGLSGTIRHSAVQCSHSC